MWKPRNVLSPEKILQSFGLSTGHTIADFGSGGSGFFTFPASRFVGKDGLVYALDIQRPVLLALRGKAYMFKHHNIRFIHGNLEKFEHIKIPHESIDRGLLINVLHLISNPIAVFENILRLLKKGGSLLVINYTEDGIRFYNHSASHIAPVACESILCSLKYEIVEVLNFGDLYYGLIVKKV